MFKPKRKKAEVFTGKPCRKCKNVIRMVSNKRCYTCATSYTENTRDKKVEYVANNKDSLNARRKAWYEENKKYELAYRKNHRDTHKEERAIAQKNHQKDNPELWRFYVNKRRAKKLKATPIWANLEKIREIYLNCPKGYEVDHIYPLQGKLVSGLHVEANLQYLTVNENRVKSNN